MTAPKSKIEKQPDEDKFMGAFDERKVQEVHEKEFIKNELKDDSDTFSTFIRRVQFFMAYSFNDISRRKLLYVIAFGAVFVCILANLLIDVVIKKGSLIFVRMSEEQQIDAQIKPSFKNKDKGENNFHFNYTRIEELEMDPSMGQLAPRITLEAIQEMRAENTGLWAKYGGREAFEG